MQNNAHIFDTQKLRKLALNVLKVISETNKSHRLSAGYHHYILLLVISCENHELILYNY